MRLIRALLLLTMLHVAHSAQAQESQPAYRRHFEQAEVAYRLGDYKKAIEEYTASYKLRPVPILLFNIAQAYRQMGPAGAERALFYYQQYIGDAPNGSRRQDAEQLASD